MEALLVIASPEKGRELILPLSLGGVRVRQVLSAGERLVAELRQGPVEAILLTDSLPDGSAEQWLKQIAALPGRPLVVVLLYGIEAAEVVRERCCAAYGPSVEVVPAGALPPQQVATQAAHLLDRLQVARAGEESAEEPIEASSPPVVISEPPRPMVTLEAPSPKPPTSLEALQQSPPPMATTEPSKQARSPAATTQPQKQTAPPPVALQPVRFGALALLGAAGGVGTSTLTANLAALVASSGGKVLVVDAGFTTGLSQAYLLGAQSDEAVRGLHHLRWGFLSGKPGTPAFVATYLDQTKVHQIELLQLPAILDAIWNLPAEQILWGFRALEHELDLVLFDLGTGIGSPRTLALMEAARRTVVVVGGWGSAVQGATRLLAALEGRPERERLWILLRETEGSAWSARTVSGALGQPVWGQLPEEPLLVTASRQVGAPMLPVIQSPSSPYAVAVRSLASTMGLIHSPPTPQAPKERRGLFGLGRRS